MIRIALCSAKGSPGVTTLACALGAVWPGDRTVVVAECDPAGGDLAVRFGLTSRLGTTSLLLSNRHGTSGTEDLQKHVQVLDGGLGVLAGPISAEAANSLDYELREIVEALSECQLEILADCGRLSSTAQGQIELIKAAHSVLLVSKGDVASLSHARGAAETLKSLHPASNVKLVVSRLGIDRAHEAASVLGLTLAGVVRSDDRAAAVAGGQPGSRRSFERSSLIAAARQIVSAELFASDPIQSDSVRSVGPEVNDQGTEERGGNDYQDTLPVLQSRSTASKMGAK